MKSIEFVVSNHKLKGNLFYPEALKDKNPGILFISGWTSKQDRFYKHAEKLSELGYLCMTFDLKGHGISEGKLEELTRKDFMDDVLAAYDYLLQLDVDPENTTVIGSSFGSYLAAILSSKRKVKNLILRVPADYPNEGFDTIPMVEMSGEVNPNVTTWRAELHVSSESYALEAIHNFGGKILIVESEKDEQVDHQTIENYLRAVKDKNITHIVMKGAPHSLSHHPNFQAEYGEILTNWLGK